MDCSRYEGCSDFSGHIVSWAVTSEGRHVTGWEAIPARKDGYCRRHARRRSFPRRHRRLRKIYRPCRVRRNLLRNRGQEMRLDIGLIFRREVDAAVT